MNVRSVYAIVLVALICNPACVLAQKPSLAPKDMDFTRGIIQKFHYTAQVSLDMGKGQTTKFQYDHYPDKGPGTEVERIKANEGVFARPVGGKWLKSDDWGQTGTAVADDLASELNTYVGIVAAQYAEPADQDPTQGAAVWKFIKKTGDKTLTLYTYERSREHPNPDGVYPRLTFMKAPKDVDGKLFMCQSTGNLRSGDQRIPFTVTVVYLIPLPKGSTVQITDPATGKVKLQTQPGDNKGIEIASQQSAPPTGR